MEDSEKIAPTYNNKQKGMVYEQLFMYEAVRRDLIPHKPILDPTCHDVVLVNKEGCPIIVQIKSIKNRCYDNRENKGCHKYVIKASCEGDRIALNDTYVDVLAIYAVNEKSWYLIPCDKIKSKTVAIFPHIEGSKGMYEKFKEGWSFFWGDQVCPKS